jgi:hypothetical protein
MRAHTWRAGLSLAWATLLAGCGIFDAIASNRETIERSTEAIERNKNTVNASTEAIRRNREAVAESTQVIESMLGAAQQGVEMLEDDPWRLLKLPVLLLFLALTAAIAAGLLVAALIASLAYRIWRGLGGRPPHATSGSGNAEGNRTGSCTLSSSEGRRPPNPLPPAATMPRLKGSPATSIRRAGSEFEFRSCSCLNTPSAALPPTCPPRAPSRPPPRRR